MLASLAALVGAGKCITADTMDPDAFWHLKVADQLVSDGIGPLVDRISFASLKTPWTPYSWLGELLMRSIWNAGGFRLAVCVTAICSAAIVLLIAGAMRTAVRRADGESNDVAVALLTFVAAWFSLPFISFRPVTFALVLMAATVWLLVADRRRATKWVWAVVPLAAVITNIHLYAGIVVALAWLSAVGRERRLSLLALAATAAACCTPMLRGAIVTALSYNGADPMVASPFITEMRPFYAGSSGRVSLVLFAVLIVTCFLGRRKLTATDWLWLALGTALLFRLGRFSPVFAMLAMPACARAMPVLNGRVLGKRLVHVALGVVLVAGVINILPALVERDFDRWLNRNTPAYPTAAARFVETNVRPRGGRMVNEFNWGGYLAWRMGESYQVLLDGRTQLYTPDFWRRTHLGDTAARTALLKTIDADVAVLPVLDSAFEPSLRALGWREVYRDRLAVVMVP